MNSPTDCRSAPEAGGLVLELRHPRGLAEAGQALQDPGQAGVLGDVALHEQRAPARVEPGGEQLRGRDAGAPAQVSSGGGGSAVSACRSTTQ